MTPTAVFDALAAHRYLSLETYRKNGVAVRTPVWFANAPAGSADGPRKLYVYTTSDLGKAKRLRRNATSRIAACDFRGGVTGEWIDTRVQIVTGEEFARGMTLIDAKYRPWKQLLDLSARLFSRHERVVLAIRLA